MMWTWGSGIWGGHWAAMVLMLVLVLALLVGAVVWLVTLTAPSRTAHRTYEEPRDGLDRRLATHTDCYDLRR